MFGNETHHGITAYRVDNDVNGNPRYVVHYLDIPYRDQHDGELFWDYQRSHIEHSKQALFGKRYRAKWFGGGIVFTSYNVSDTIKRALETPSD